MKDAVVSVVIFLWVFGSQCIFQTTSQTTQPEPVCKVPGHIQILLHNNCTLMLGFHLSS